MNLAKSRACLGFVFSFCTQVYLAAGSGGNEAPRISAPRILSIGSYAGGATAVLINDVPLIHTTQLLPLDQRGELVGLSNVVEQAGQALANVGIVLKANESDLTQLIKLNVYLSQAEALTEVQKMLALRLPANVKPATCFVIGDLPIANALVAMDAIAITKPPEPGIKRVTRGALYDQKGIQPAAILPAGGKVYVSGMADTNDLPIATIKTLEKLIAVIGHLGLEKKDIVQLKAFLQPMSEAARVRKEIVGFFQGDAPPLVLVEWISPPPNPPIEIELIASAKQDLSKETNSVSFFTPPGTTSTKVFSRVVRVNHGYLIYFSGLQGNSPNDPGAQTRQIFRSIDALLKNAGTDLEHLVKATYYVSDNEASDKLNEIRPEFFNPDRPPAGSKAKVKSTGVSGKPITIDMIAVTR